MHNIIFIQKIMDKDGRMSLAEIGLNEPLRVNLFLIACIFQFQSE